MMTFIADHFGSRGITFGSAVQRLLGWAPWLIPLTYFCAWTALTASGATLALTEKGRTSLEKFLGSPLGDTADVLGSGVYIALLVMPYILAPVGIFIGYAATKRIVRWLLGGRCIHVEPSVAVLYVIAILASSYAFWKMAVTGHLVPYLLFSGAGYEEIIAQRAKIIADLGFLPYCAIYAVLPMTCVIFLASLLRGKRHRSLHAIGFALTFVATVYLDVAIFMKAPLLIFFVMLAFAMIFIGWKLWLVPMIAAAAALAFYGLQLAVGGFVPQPDQAALPDAAVLIEEPATPPETPGIMDSYAAQAAVNIVESIAFRMGSAFPYYVSVFEAPTQRCGIETNSLPLLPHPECIMARKVFDAMYPHVYWAEGFAPAAAHVSAYGEIGLGYSAFIVLISGLSLGILTALTAINAGPISVGFGVAGVVYAYNLTQVPFLGAVTYANGFLFLVMPVLIVAIASVRRVPNQVAEP